MDLAYVLTKSADMSFKAFPLLRNLQELPDKFNLETYLHEFNIGAASDNADSADTRDKMRRYNDLKETILKQISSYCIYIGYYQQESNNHLSEHYFRHFLQATDKALSEPLEKLEKVLEQDDCDYDPVQATALGIRYAIDKGLLKVEEQ